MLPKHLLRKAQISCLMILCGFLSFAQTGNHVFTGDEANSFSIVDLAIPGGQTWSTDRQAIPGYFSATGSASYNNASDTYNINGYVKHYANVANQSFGFPVGSGADYRDLSVSGTRTATSIIAVAWISGDPSGNLDPTAPNAGVHAVTSVGTGVSSVSNIGQWDWQDVSNDAAGLTVTVSIPDLTAFGTAGRLRLVGWNGTQWVNLSGTTGALGNTENSLLSGTMIAGITALGIGIGDPCNPIPTPTPTIAAVNPTCVPTLGTITVTNYDALAIYTFIPSGPTVGASGVVSSFVLNQPYTLSATKNGCQSSVSSSFAVNNTNCSDSDGDGVFDVDEPVGGVNDPCLPAKPAGYTGFTASNGIWAAADCDGDGFSNGKEITAGTDPYDIDSQPTDLFVNFTFGNAVYAVGNERMVIININEINGTATDGSQIEFFVPAIAGFNLTFDNTLTTATVLTPQSVNNSSWSITTTGTGLIFRSSVIIPAFGRSRIALRVTASTLGTAANITANITPQSGRDINPFNNIGVLAQSIQN